MIYGPFYSVGRFGYSCGPFWILPWAVLDISKIYGPFWSGPFWFMGRFGIDTLQLPHPGHPTYPAPTDHRTGSDTGLQSDFVLPGLLQRCVAWSPGWQHPETAAHPEHSSTRRSSSAKTIICSAAPGTTSLASRSSTN